MAAPPSARGKAFPPEASSKWVNVSGWRRWLPRDPYTIAALFVFLVIVILCWTSYIEPDEELYFLGSRRIADPGFLAVDFTWSRLPPTSALFDHLLAPLWWFLDEFAIANLGRLVFWGLMAWSIAFLARAIRIPAWSVVVGFTAWLLWGQNLATCGAPIQGFQVKSLAYPLMFFALAFAMRGQVARAGMAAGLGTAFHIIVGGWGCLALFLSMLINRRQFSLRQLGVFLLSAAPFIIPLLLSVARFHEATASPTERARMPEVYAMFAMPRCCDVFFFMSLVPTESIRAAVIFVIAPIVTFAWPERRAASIVGAFVASVILFFLVGVLGRWLELYALLQLYPFQLANALPALFLFMFVAGWIGIGGARRRLGVVVWSLVIAGAVWLLYDHKVGEVLLAAPRHFIDEVHGLSVTWKAEVPPLPWIRENTPRNSVFITSFIPDFWAYAERAQVASMRHPPLDRRVLEWRERLEALNGFRPYTQKGIENAKEQAVHESQLSVHDLIRIRKLYGATHYVVEGERKDLSEHLLHSDKGYSVYDITRLTEGNGH